MNAATRERPSLAAEQSPIAAVLSRLPDARQSGKGYKARCPAHDDDRASLSITETPEGAVLLHCHADCAKIDVLSKLGLNLKDLFPASTRVNRQPSRQIRIEAEYDYHDEDGVLLYQIVRLAGKQFKARQPAPRGGWKWQIGDVRRVLYRLPEVVRSVANGTPIFVVEGEKDADALRRHGLTATTNPGGAGKWRDSFSQSLAGADVIVIPDADPVGQQHGQAVAGKLIGIARSIRVLHLPDLEVGGIKDATDWLASGHTADELALLAKSADLWERNDHALPTIPEGCINPVTDLDGFTFIDVRRDLTPGAKAVYRNLCWHGRTTGCAFPREETIAAELGLSRRCVAYAVEQLQAKGLLKVKRAKVLKSHNYYFFPRHEWMLAHLKTKAALTG